MSMTNKEWRILEDKTRRELLIQVIESNPMISRREIQNKLKEFYPITSSNIYLDTSLHIMTRDVRAINNDFNYPYIIASSPRGLKIANKQETIQALEKEKNEILRRLKRYYNKCKKVGLDNQIDIYGETFKINEEEKQNA